MRPIETLQSDDPSHIYCIGDNYNVLKFEIGYMNWFKIPVENDKRSKDAFDGNIRYGSICYVPPSPDAKIILTGGCYTTNGFPSANVAEFRVKSLKTPTKKKNMLLKRYGHIAVYLNGMVYAMGGFSHKDLPNEQPVTLSACERFSVTAEN